MQREGFKGDLAQSKECVLIDSKINQSTRGKPGSSVKLTCALSNHYLSEQKNGEREKSRLFKYYENNTLLCQLRREIKETDLHE